MAGISIKAAWRQEIGETLKKLGFGKQCDKNVYGEKLGI
jgi:hypothetical protein